MYVSILWNTPSHCFRNLLNYSSHFIIVEEPMKEKTSRRQKNEKMFAMIEDYLSSGLTQKSFCQRESIVYSTFGWWLRKYRQSRSLTAQKEKADRRFIPIHPTSPQSSSQASGYSCAIEYPNGVTLRLGGKLDFEFLNHLIQLRFDWYVFIAFPA